MTSTSHVYTGADERFHGKQLLQLPSVAHDDIFGNIYVVKQVMSNSFQVAGFEGENFFVRARSGGKFRKCTDEELGAVPKDFIYHCANQLQQARESPVIDLCRDGDETNEIPPQHEQKSLSLSLFVREKKLVSLHKRSGLRLHAKRETVVMQVHAKKYQLFAWTKTQQRGILFVSVVDDQPFLNADGKTPFSDFVEVYLAAPGLVWYIPRTGGRTARYTVVTIYSVSSGPKYVLVTTTGDYDDNVPSGELLSKCYKILLIDPFSHCEPALTVELQVTQKAVEKQVVFHNLFIGGGRKLLSPDLLEQVAEIKTPARVLLDKAYFKPTAPAVQAKNKRKSRREITLLEVEKKKILDLRMKHTLQKKNAAALAKRQKAAVLKQKAAVARKLRDVKKEIQKTMTSKRS